MKLILHRKKSLDEEQMKQREVIHEGEQRYVTIAKKMYNSMEHNSGGASGEHQKV